MEIFQTESGQKYFCIYAVVANKIEDEERVTIQTFANYEKALDYRDFAKDVFRELYKNIYVKEELVWL